MIMTAAAAAAVWASFYSTFIDIAIYILILQELTQAFPFLLQTETLVSQ
jgi:hypothetical protein